MNLRMKMAVSGVMATVATFAAAGVAAAAPAPHTLAPMAHYSVECGTFWNDAYTFGVSCSFSDPNSRVQAIAQCTNGQTVYGAWVGNGQWSYAYCSSVGSTLRTGSWDVRR